MKPDRLTADRIGAAWLRAALAPQTDIGRRADEAALPYGPPDASAARARCAEIAGLAQTLSAQGVARLRTALRRIPDPTDIVSRATFGDALSDVDFFELARFSEALEATAQGWDAAGGERFARPPVVTAVAALLGRGFEGGGFYLSDGFAAGLGAARADYAAADAEVMRARRRLAEALETELGMVPEGEEFIAMRDAVPAVPPGTRVVREAAAYRLLALELDDPAVAAVERRDACLARLTQAEERARRDLAAGVAAAGPEILAAAGALGELDRTLARVAFTQRWGGCVPAISASRFAFSNASFVPLRAALAEAGLRYTPISLDLPGVAVLTGPNMGGKSAALATCGFLAACVAVGVPPPAEEATLPLVASIGWIGSEPTADPARLLSAFGTEVVRARDALAAAEAPALLLVDEFARTTGPREGRALLVALAEELARRGAFALIATHFDDVARDAGVAGFRVAGLDGRSPLENAGRDVHAALDAIASAMDYRIVVDDGTPRPSSDALAVAGLLGLDPAIVARAGVLFTGGDPGPPERASE
ncbi:MAG: hypothetical protein ABSB70_24400 [Candidatus Velthaea sp.]